MYPCTVYANKYPVIDGSPFRMRTGTIETNLVVRIFHDEVENRMRILVH
jgi:hypothetical protein